MTERTSENDKIGHIFGNFHNYYSFHSVESRLSFITADVIRNAWNNIGRPTTFHMLDVGCNEGNLSLQVYHQVNEILTSYGVKCTMFGIDIDDELIDRANAKAKDQLLESNVHFQAINIMDTDCDKIESHMRNHQCERFHLVTAFSVTMWIHLNYDDIGLRTFLRRISSISNVVIIEPQNWKSYKNAVKRSRKLELDKPKYFDHLKLRDDIHDQIIKFLNEDVDCKFDKYETLGQDTWGRSLHIFTKIKSTNTDHLLESDKEEQDSKDARDTMRKRQKTSHDP